jgi:hypothetical protein
MVALIVSYLVVAYLLAPRAIFRLWSGIFLPLRFERTRSDEIAFAFWISIVPLFVAWFGMASILGPPGHGTIRDYKEVFAASYQESVFASDPERFWRSTQSVMLAQLEFLLLYYFLVLAEAVTFVFLVRMYGRWKSFRPYRWLVEEVFLRRVNEWHVLLTDFNFPRKPKRRVVADLLTQEDHLYQGDVADHFTDSDGALSGLVLENPRRFDRPGYLRAKEKGGTIEVEDYWKDIPGENLFVPGEKILSLNLRYEPTPSEAAETATRELIKSGEGLKVEVPIGLEPDPTISIIGRRKRARKARGTASLRCPICASHNVPALGLPQILADGSEHWDVSCFGCDKQNGVRRQFHRVPADDRQEPCPQSCPYYGKYPG